MTRRSTIATFAGQGAGLRHAALVLLLAAAPACHAAGWSYNDGLDEVSGTTVHEAALPSSNSLNLPAPLAGRNPGTLAVRGVAGQAADVVVSIARGRIACRAPAGCRLAVRFDAQSSVSFTGTEAADTATSAVLLQPGAKFVDAAKKAKKIRIELPVESAAGPQALEFDAPVGLQWAAAAAAKKAGAGSR